MERVLFAVQPVVNNVLYLFPKEKKKFRYERDLWLDRIASANAEFSRIKIEISGVVAELNAKNEELKAVVAELDRARAETEDARKEKETYEKALSGGNRILLDLSGEIEKKTLELNKLKSEIDAQIKANKEKEEDALREIRKEVSVSKQKLAELDSEIQLKTERKNNLLEEVKILEIKVKKEDMELNEKIKEKEDCDRKMKSENEAITGRMAAAGTREKQLNVYNARIQRWAKKLNVQLKNV